MTDTACSNNEKPPRGTPQPRGGSFLDFFITSLDATADQNGIDVGGDINHASDVFIGNRLTVASGRSQRSRSVLPQRQGAGGQGRGGGEEDAHLGRVPDD